MKRHNCKYTDSLRNTTLARHPCVVYRNNAKVINTSVYQSTSSEVQTCPICHYINITEEFPVNHLYNNLGDELGFLAGISLTKDS